MKILQDKLITLLENRFGTLLEVRRLAVIQDDGLFEFLLSNADFTDRFFRIYKLNDKDIFHFKQMQFLQFLDLKILGKSYTAFANKIGLASDNKFIQKYEKVVINFPFKDGVLKGSQSKDEQKSDEVFFNDILAHNEIDVLFEPKAFQKFELINNDENIKDENTLFENKNKLIDLKNALKDPNTNYLIKGNNLLALHSLKYNKNIYGQVKLIYIDPPYNTGNDSFNYNDRFNHSTWLCFMKNRLEIARKFLRDDGCIFIQCDDNEQAYLKVLCDEIFGRENFDSCITHIVKPEGRMYGNIAKTHEYILVYAKNSANLEFNEIEKNEHKFEFEDEFGGFNLKNLENGNFRAFNSTNRPNLRFSLYIDETQIDENNFFKIYTEKQEKFIEILPTSKSDFDYVWRWSKEKCNNEIYNLCAKKINNKFIIFQKQRKSTTRVKSIFWEKEFITKRATDEIKALFANSGVDLFATPKPEALLKRIIEISTKEGDLVMDFFAGSGTTLAVAHKMNRRYVGIEQMDYIQSITKERLIKVINGEQGGISKSVGFEGGGSFVYAELMPLNVKFKELILKADENINELYKELKIKAFLDYRINNDELDEAFENANLKEKKHILLDILDSNMDYVLFNDIDDSDLNISNEIIKLNKEFYKSIENDR